MSDSNLNVINLYTKVVAHLKRYKWILVIFMFIGVIISLIGLYLKAPTSTSEFIFRTGEIEDPYVVDMLLVLNKDALISHLDTGAFDDAKKLQRLKSDLSTISSIQFSVLQRSNYKAIVKFNHSTTDINNIEQNVLKAISSNSTFRNYKKNQIQLIEYELNMVENSILSTTDINKNLLTEPNISFPINQILLMNALYPDIINLLELRRKLRQELENLSKIEVIRPIEIDSYILGNLRYTILNVILLFFGGIIITIILEINRLSKENS